MYKKSKREQKIEKAERETRWFAIKSCVTVFVIVVIFFILL
jgi:hypothetical protein